MPDVKVKKNKAGTSVEEWSLRLVEKATDLVCLCRGGQIEYINAAGVKLLGFNSAKKALGNNFGAFIHPDYAGLTPILEECLVGECSPVPIKLVTQKGRNIDCEIMVLPFGDSESDVHIIQARNITDSVRSAKTLHDREQRLRGIVDTVADAIITIDQKGIIQSFNPAAVSMFGYTLNDVIGKNVKVLVPPPHSKKHDGYIRRYLKTGKKKIIGVTNREELARRKDGTIFPIEIAVTEMMHGTQRLFTGIVRDITERKKAEEELQKANDELEMRVEERTLELTEEIGVRRQAESRLRLAGEVIDNLSEAVIIVDEKFMTTSVNPAFSEITGYNSGDVIGKHPPFYVAMKKDKSLLDRMWQEIKNKGRWEKELWIKHKNGKDYAERISVSAITNEAGKVTQYAAVISDITKRKQDEERIHYQANFDPLTGLPNRAMFHDRLNHALPTMIRANRKLALMFIDLDGFKLINDTLGHDVGDLLLKEASVRLLGCVREGDTVARLGGDEFTVIMPNLVDPRHAPLVGQRVLDALVKPFHMKGHEAFVSGSIGITIFPDDATEAGDLLKNADAAMYSAKDKGKSNFQFFTNDLNEEVKERAALKNGLNKALEKNELQLHYQPKLDTKSGQIMGVEALMRWNSPELGFVSPARFIPVMEETGVVVEAGEWALRTACKQHRKWLDEGLPSIRVAVNLSARQLRDGLFVSIVKNVMDETGIKPDGLEIEITESMLMEDAAKAVVALRELHDMGIHIAMDDFGTGYSSLSYLKRFPIDTIKIDRSFVMDITTSPDDAEIIRTIIIMGKTLNRKVVAEGVETEDQLVMLEKYECDEIQGYFFSRPLPADESTRFMIEHMRKGDTHKRALP